MLFKKPAKKDTKNPSLGTLPVVCLDEKEMSNVSGGKLVIPGPPAYL